MNNHRFRPRVLMVVAFIMALAIPHYAFADNPPLGGFDNIVVTLDNAPAAMPSNIVVLMTAPPQTFQWNTPTLAPQALFMQDNPRQATEASGMLPDGGAYSLIFTEVTANTEANRPAENTEGNRILMRGSHISIIWSQSVPNFAP